VTEAEAQDWLAANLGVSRGTIERLSAFVTFLEEENSRQNLISSSTIRTVWTRHIVDSAQLLVHAGHPKSWIDLGTGAGFPGVVVAVLSGANVTMVESRRKRVEFLDRAIDLLGVGHTARVLGTNAERVPAEMYDVISARAFAPIDRLLPIGARFSGPKTRWLLPKGRGAKAELEEAKLTWQGEFRIEPSVTDPESAILVAEQVRPRRQR
jgi:16S rRNA (guanine527-N7)-methyltransferase